MDINNWINKIDERRNKLKLSCIKKLNEGISLDEDERSYCLNAIFKTDK